MSDLTPAEQFKNTRKRADNASGAANGSSVTGDTIDTKNYDIINSYNFVLRVEGFQNLPLKAVRGINKQNEYEYIQEGGLNDYVHMVRKPISQPFTFQVERYVAQGWLKDAIDPLANGTELMLPLVLYMYRSNAHDGTAPSRYYIFTNCRVTGVQVGDLDAEKSGLHTITNTIAYAQMMIVTLPFLGIDDDGMYKFNKDNKYENKENTSHVRTLTTMGYTKMKKPTEKNSNETDEAFAIRSASVDYRGNRSKEDMKSLSIKYKYEEKKPVKDKDGKDTVDREKVSNKNTKQVVAQKNNREGEIRKYAPKEEGSKISANTKNTEKAKTKEALKSAAIERKYVFKIGDNLANKVNIEKNVAKPTKKSIPKSDKVDAAKERKYVFKIGDDLANNANIEENVATPTKKSIPKSDKIDAAKERKYKFNKDENANTVNIKENIAEPEKESLTKSKLEEAAIARKYEFNKNEKANEVNIKGNVAEPEKTAESKSAKEKTAKRRKYKFKNGTKANLTHLNAEANNNQLTKTNMEEKAKKYGFERESNGSAVHDDSEIRKNAMLAKAEAYNSKPHYVSQDNKKAEVRNSYRFGEGPTDNVALPLIQIDKKRMEKAARKYPKTRSAKDVSEFLGRKK